VKIKFYRWVWRKGERKRDGEERICRPGAQIKIVSFILIYHKHSFVDVALERG
jgi:hypothetical protein